MWAMFVVCLVLWCIILRKLKACEPSPPEYPGALPLIGHAHIMLRIQDKKQLWNFVKEVSERCVEVGGIMKTYLCSRFHTIYIIADPDDFLTVSNTCLKKPYVYTFAKDWVSAGLFTADESTWKIHRKMLQPSFSPQVLNDFIGVLNSQACDLADKLTVQVGKGPFNPKRIIIDNVMETVCLTTLQLSTKNLLGKEYAHASEEIFNVFIERFKRLWLHSNYIFSWSSLKTKQDKLIKIATGISNDIVLNRKQEVIRNTNSFENVDHKSGKFKPLLDRLLDLRTETDAFTDKEIREHLDAIIIASFDTTFRSAMLILLVIGHHADTQEKLYKELQEIFGSSRTEVERQDLAKLVYMEAVIMETLRLFPIAPLIARSVTTRTKLKNYTLPAGCICLMSIYGLHRHPTWGPEPHKFIPERWLDKTTFPQNANAFAAFSLGQRNCIGKRYATMLIKIILVHLLRRYRITSDLSNLVLEQDIMLEPVSGQEIALELRN